jgi:uronate dehydrogenase
MNEPILITGGAGHVAGLISPLLRREFRLRRLDTVEQEPGAEDEVVTGDVRDLEVMHRACDGVAAVVHLAAQPTEDDFRTALLPLNLDGTWAAYEAAVRAGVRRFVFASTIQVVDGYPLETFVSPVAPPKPVSVYGCTKAFGEALGRFHADTSGLGVACLRLGAVVPPDHPRLATDARFRSVWCDPDDLARLVVAAIRSDVRFATVIAVSPPATSRFDTANPFGWQPVGQPCSSGGRSATM